MAPIILAALKIAASFAPQLLESTAGTEVAGKVVEIAQAVTGATSPDSAFELLKADPQKALEFQQSILVAEVDIKKAELADMASARHLQEVALQQEDIFSKRFVYYFAAAWSLFTMFYISAITFWPPQSESGKAIANTVLGFLLGTAVASIFSYFFGSTAGGKAKSALLALAGK